MRNLNEVDENGIAMSRGYGFVSFTRHDDALTALRAINNNPTIFTSSRRPIVEFSIENLNVLKAKDKRSEVAQVKGAKSSSIGMVDKHKKKVSPVSASSTSSDKPDFCGLVAAQETLRQGKKKLHVHLGPKVRIGFILTTGLILCFYVKLVDFG